MLEEIKRILGLSDAPKESIDPLLLILIANAKARLLVLAGVREVPEELSYILKEVVVARYNRIGSEGAASHEVSGESMRFGEDEFKPYQKDLDAYRASQAKEKRGKVIFF